MNMMKGFHRAFGGEKVFKDPKNSSLMRDLPNKSPDRLSAVNSELTKKMKPK